METNRNISTSIYGGFIKGNIARNIITGGGNNLAINSGERQTLAKAANEIQALLRQLEQNNPAATDSEKITYIDDETTPSFKRRVVSALQSGGVTSIEELFDSHYVNIVKAVIKDWIKAE